MRRLAEAVAVLAGALGGGLAVAFFCLGTTWQPVVLSLFLGYLFTVAVLDHDASVVAGVMFILGLTLLVYSLVILGAYWFC